jgi:hypothetical protein
MKTVFNNHAFSLALLLLLTMKKRIQLLILWALLVPVATKAQTDTFHSGKVGIGTSTPQKKLHLDVANVRDGITIVGNGDSDAYSDFSFQIKDQTNIPVGKPVAYLISHRKDGYFSNSEFSSLEFYSIKSGGGYFAPLSLKSNGDVILASNLHATSGNVGIGTTTPTQKLEVNGTIRAKEIKLEASNWPDYVFEKDYKLMPLEEVKAHIDQNGHLPGLKSAREYEEEGVDMMELNRKLLEKIEELTLYMISLKKEMDSLNGPMKTKTHF